MGSPFLAQGTTEYSIYSGPHCVALNIGVDARSLVPLFAPFFRNQDAVFGHLLTMSSEHFQGHIPLLIEHRGKEIAVPDHDISHLFTTAGSLTVTVLERVRRPDSGAPYIESLTAAADLFSQLSREPSDRLRTFIDHMTAQKYAMYADHYRNLIRSIQNPPPYWETEMNTLIKSCEQLSTSPSKLPFFWNMPEYSKDPESGWNMVKKWFEIWSECLIFWPLLFHASLDKNSSLV
jgi:hypothetical protein